jgi:hypothetical protein
LYFVMVFSTACDSASITSMAFAGYVAVCVQLYCRCFTVLHLVSLFYTTCFGLYGHLQVCRMFYFRIPEGICFADFTCTWLHFARFHLCFPVLFSSLILLFHACVFVCLPFLVPCCRQTHTHETAKLTRKTEQENTNGNVQSVITCK